MLQTLLRSLPTFLSLSTLATVLGCASSAWKPADGPKPDAVVAMHFHDFEPKTITIKSGGTVRWENKTIIGHTITDDPSKAKKAEDAALPHGAEAFDLGEVGGGGAVQHTFTVPGTYRYFCKPHELTGMVGEVVVTPAPQ